MHARRTDIVAAPLLPCDFVAIGLTVRRRRAIVAATDVIRLVCIG
jgi:hypothetical protein